MDTIEIRHPNPEDYKPIITVINDWWGGRKMGDMLPKLFFIHFRDTSFVAESGGQIVGFLIGFLSQIYLDQAYIHFVGVHPDYRKMGVGRSLYEHFFQSVEKNGRNEIHCITAPINKTSIAFHRSMGFTFELSDTVIDGIPVAQDYDGPGSDRVLFRKTISG
jgi:predicted GNAT superfamily acetyltransferase